MAFRASVGCRVLSNSSGCGRTVADLAVVACWALGVPSESIATLGRVTRKTLTEAAFSPLLRRPRPHAPAADSEITLGTCSSGFYPGRQWLISRRHLPTLQSSRGGLRSAREVTPVARSRSSVHWLLVRNRLSWRPTRRRNKDCDQLSAMSDQKASDRGSVHVLVRPATTGQSRDQGSVSSPAANSSKHLRAFFPTAPFGPPALCKSVHKPVSNKTSRSNRTLM